MVFFLHSSLKMIKKKIYVLIKKIILIYIFLFPGKLKFLSLTNLNFKLIDFNNYEKNKSLIFKKDFFKNEINPIVYNYDFINLCNKLGGKRGIEIAKNNIFKWHETYKFKASFIWNSDEIAKRVLNLIYNFDFINSISTKKEEYKLKKILKININAFNKFILTKNIGDYSLPELKAEILSKHILEDNIQDTINKFYLIVQNQIDNFSMHKSYNLFEQTKFINDINEIISMLLNFKSEVPEIFNQTKIKMEATLAQYFHKDRSVALFNGTNNNDIEKIRLALKENQNIRKLQFPNDINGIFYFEDKYKKIFLDAVQPTNSLQSKRLSAGTLSIEFSADKEKIITNCGALDKLTGNASYLRYSAAHSTIILENTNISEIRENQPHIKFPQTVSLKQHEESLRHDVEISHNGYIKNYKKIVKRKISFLENECCLTGEDSIISSTAKNKEVIFHVRFHIMPNINITETNNKKSIILKTANNSIWVFKSNKDLVLEESIFMDKNDVKETKQIVIKGITRLHREKINWTLIKK